MNDKVKLAPATHRPCFLGCKVLTHKACLAINNFEAMKEALEAAFWAIKSQSCNGQMEAEKKLEFVLRRIKNQEGSL